MRAPTPHRWRAGALPPTEVLSLLLETCALLRRNPFSASHSVAAIASVLLAACASGPAGEPTATVSTADSCPAGSLPQGVDTSSGQGKIAWASARDAGVAWAVMKATQGNYDDDSAFPTNWPAAKAAGVVRGAYHFFDPTLDGVVQAKYFLAAVGPLDAEDLSPMLDVECPTGYGSTGAPENCLGFSGGTGFEPAAGFRTHLLDWLSTVEAATGRKPIIYTYVSFFAGTGADGTGTDVDTTGLDAYPLWIANYTGTSCFTVPAPWSAAALWQYDDNGSFTGISSAVDVDRAVAPLDELLGWPVPKRSTRADVNGDGRADGCGRDPSGVVCALSTGGTFGAPFRGPAWSDVSGWRPPAYASTVQFADVNGDGMSDVCARGPAGVTCALSTGSAFGAPFAGPAWSDAEGWNAPAYYATVQLADVDGDGKADACGRGIAGIACALSTGTGFGAQFAGPSWSDAAGWNAADHYRSIRFVDIDGDGRADACGRAADGIHCALSGDELRRRHRRASLERCLRLAAGSLCRDDSVSGSERRRQGRRVRAGNDGSDVRALDRGRLRGSVRGAGLERCGRMERTVALRHDHVPRSERRRNGRRVRSRRLGHDVRALDGLRLRAGAERSGMDRCRRVERAPLLRDDRRRRRERGRDGGSLRPERDRARVRRLDGKRVQRPGRGSRVERLGLGRRALLGDHPRRRPSARGGRPGRRG